jgi:hypothetical protein
MKNTIAYIKANKTVIIKRTLIVAGTAVAISLVAYVAKNPDRFADDSIEITNHPDGSFTVSEVTPAS